MLQDPRAAAHAFRLADVPPGFADDPAPWWTALREHDPVHEIGRRRCC